MNLVAYLNDEFTLSKFEKYCIQDAIICHNRLSTLGGWSSKKVNNVAKECKDKNINPILDWDLLMTQEDFDKTVNVISKKIDLSNFYAVRVKDVGGFYYLIENYPELRIQLNLELGNSNYDAIRCWAKYYFKKTGKKLDRILLSKEIEKKDLEVIKNNIDVPFELLGYGKLLLFNTPRKLLTLCYGEPVQNAVGQSEESPHKGFLILENQHGTYMFNPKDFSLMEHKKILEQIGIDFIRLDFRAVNKEYHEMIIDYFMKEGGKPFAQKDTVWGFFNKNKSDVIFSKLKNTRTKSDDFNYLGEVLEVQKGKYIVFDYKNSTIEISGNMDVIFLTPSGATIKSKIESLRDFILSPIQKTNSTQILVAKHIKGCEVGSVIYRDI